MKTVMADSGGRNTEGITMVKKGYLIRTDGGETEIFIGSDLNTVKRIAIGLLSADPYNYSAAIFYGEKVAKERNKDMMPVNLVGSLSKKFRDGKAVNEFYWTINHRTYEIDRKGKLKR